MLLSGLNAFVWVVTQVLLGGCYQSVTGWSERVCMGCYQSVTGWLEHFCMSCYLSVTGWFEHFSMVVTRVLLSGLNALLWVVT